MSPYFSHRFCHPVVVALFVLFVLQRPGLGWVWLGFNLRPAVITTHVTCHMFVYFWSSPSNDWAVPNFNPYPFVLHVRVVMPLKAKFSDEGRTGFTGRILTAMYSSFHVCMRCMNLSEQNTMAKPLATACHLPFQVEDNEDETNGKEISEMDIHEIP